VRIRGAQRARGALRAARWWHVRRKLAGPKLLRAFAEVYPNAEFVEIGANDGEHHDHLRPFIRSRSWSGVMVEPVPYVFERLRRNYGDLDGVVLENVAIADRDGELPFYHLAEVGEEKTGVPRWYDGLGSFNREVVLRNAKDIARIEAQLVETSVPALTFESLCRRHGLEGPDLLLMDTEGYDRVLLESIDFTPRKPRIVIYEHFHLRPDERDDCRGYMESCGYETMEEGFDTWCVDVRADDLLTRTWRRTRPGLPAASAYQGD
jgi:FkbM family methyltransferase